MDPQTPPRPTRAVKPWAPKRPELKVYTNRISFRTPTIFEEIASYIGRDTRFQSVFFETGSDDYELVHFKTYMPEYRFLEWREELNAHLSNNRFNAFVF